MSNPPDTTPLVITQFSAAVGHRGTEHGGYFCWKLTLTRTPDSIRPTKGSKQGGLWPRGVCPGGGFGRTPPETIRDSRTEFNRVLCTSKSEVTVTINKLRCRWLQTNTKHRAASLRQLSFLSFDLNNHQSLKHQQKTDAETAPPLTVPRKITCVEQTIILCPPLKIIHHGKYPPDYTKNTHSSLVTVTYNKN